ncbi:MAG: tetratricopeptide repeat protein [Chloroflexota bacterium]|nr:MAG: tetratricopeptide repeat protein [Chloroflexota bacterium]
MAGHNGTTTLEWSRAYHDGVRLADCGDIVRAAPALLRAVHLAERMGKPDERLACSLYALGRLHRVNGRFAEAERLLRRAMFVETRALGSAHPYTRQIARAYALLLRRMGHDREAARIERAIAPVTSGPAHSDDAADRHAA